MCQFPLGLTFFGLTLKYRANLFTQIHDLVFHGGGGFKHSEVYNMPIWMRRFHIKKINEFNETQKEEIEKGWDGKVIHISHDFTEKENIRHLEDLDAK